MNWEDFSALFDISRQAMDKRRRKNNLYYDEIIKLFPNVNRDWLHSEDVAKIKSLPVNNKFTSGVNQTTGDHAQNMNTELGDRVQTKILKYIAEAKKGTVGNPQDPILSALRDQLESQRAMFDAQVKNIDSMIVILDSLVRKNNS